MVDKLSKEQVGRLGANEVSNPNFRGIIVHGSLPNGRASNRSSTEQKHSGQSDADVYYFNSDIKYAYNWLAEFKIAPGLPITFPGFEHLLFSDVIKFDADNYFTQYQANALNDDTLYLWQFSPVNLLISDDGIFVVIHPVRGRDVHAPKLTMKVGSVASRCIDVFAEN